MEKFKIEYFRALLEIIIIPLVFYTSTVLTKMADSINSLNVQVGVLVSQNTGIDRRVSDLESKVYRK